MILFLLVAGTTFQIVQSDENDQFQNTGSWMYPINWFTNIATSNLINFSSKVTDKIINVFKDELSVPNKEMVKGDVSNMKMLDGNVAETYITSKTISSQDLVLDNGQVIKSSQD